MLVTKVVLWFFFPPLPSPPLLIKGTEMLMTAFPTGGMGHWDAICNLGVNLGKNASLVLVLGCAFLWTKHPPGTLGPEVPHKPLLCTWGTGKIGEKLPKLR